MPPHGCEHDVTAASHAPHTSCFLSSTLCGIHAPERLCQFPHRLLHVASVSGGWAMTFEEILDQAIAMLQRRRRVSYRTLKLQFHLDEEALEALKEELIEVHHLAVDQDGRMLVWTGAASPTPVSPFPPPLQQAISLVDQAPHIIPPAAAQPPPDAERRQLTVLFCDL